MTISDFVRSIERHPDFEEAFVSHRHLPSRSPVYGTPVVFHEDISMTMKTLGLTRLYSHQVEAVEHLRRGKNVLVATPTASGKSLVYNLVVLEEILKNRDMLKLSVKTR